MSSEGEKALNIIHIYHRSLMQHNLQLQRDIFENMSIIILTQKLQNFY